MSTNGMPLVSVVTPVYNGADFIAECIESVQKQTYSNFEYIILNNCSKDDTLAIVRRYAQGDARIIVHDATEFVGVIENHNRVLRLMAPTSKYCKVISADDWLFPDCLNLMVKLAEANPSVGLVGSYSIAGQQVLWQGLEYGRQVVSGREIAHATLTGGPYVFGSPTSLLYRSDLVRKRDPFYPNSSPHADTSACYQCLETSDFGFVHQVLSYTRVHAESQTSSSLHSGSINRALISDMIQFGPRYLNGEELKKNLGARVDKYYRWLVPALIENSFSKAFLETQRAALAELGLELSEARLLKAALLRGAEFLQQPAATMGKISAMARRKGKVEARYY